MKIIDNHVGEEGYIHSYIVFHGNGICVTTNKPDRTRRVHIWRVFGVFKNECEPVISFNLNLFDRWSNTK